MIPIYLYTSLEDIINNHLHLRWFEHEKEKKIMCSTIIDKKYNIEITNIKEEKYIEIRTYTAGLVNDSYFAKIKLKYEINEKEAKIIHEPEIEIKYENIFGLKKILIMHENDFIYLDHRTKLLIRHTEFKHNKKRVYQEIDLLFHGFIKDKKIIIAEDEEEYLERSSYFRRY